ncbi:MAG TPA: extracellular solute-binding protein [Dehalococcoidia bacterium]|nr:extracellular solute-binding protein [Dehalococcoidia bacterium]HLB29004.1 extracellular solute-binding protein [Dehalococcoidia bacterium]
MGRSVALLALLGGLLALAACAAEERATPPPATSPTAAVKPAWEQEWDRVLAAAKQEGKVGVVSAALGTAVREALTEPFQKKYGIQVDFLSGPGGEISGRVKTERAAGKYLWDVYISGLDTMLRSFKPEGALEPLEPALILPEVKEGKNWLGGQLQLADKDRMGLVMVTYSKSDIWINTDLVKPDEIKSWRDLLDPKWKGKIVADDPRVSGPGPTAFAFLYQHKDLGPDFIRELAKQQLVFSRDYSEPVQWLGQGKYAILVGGSDQLAYQLIKQGAPLRMVDPRKVKEGGELNLGSGGVALMSKAPHPNAAKVYLNWLLSKDGQVGFAQAVGYASRRLDVPTDHVPPEMRPAEGLWPAYTEEAVELKNAKVIPFVKEIFGE